VLTNNYQNALCAALEGADYFVIICRFGFILCRRVECPHPGGGESERYYVESSGIIPIESGESPIVALFMATLLTILHVLPDPPKVSAPTPYTVKSPMNAPQVHTLIVPHSLSDGRRTSARLPATHVHFDIRGFMPDTVFALAPFITPKSPPNNYLNETYNDWANDVLARRELPMDDGDHHVLSPQEYHALMDSPTTIHVDELVHDFAPMGLVLRGRLKDRPICISCSPVRMEGWAKLDRDRWPGRQALLYRTNLASLQGKLVPRFLGLYLTENMSILVTEDPGTETGAKSKDERCVTVTRMVFLMT
jgi:hypothetical protein